MASLGFSWADEVELEEQEEMERAKRKHTREEEEESGRDQDEEQQPKRRPDPFGAARPREVVLQEKGVDWRKLDRELEAHSNLRKDKKLMGNISVTTSTISEKEHPAAGLSSRTDQKKPNPNARIIWPQKHQNIEELVPPLKYPPKNIVSLMERIRRGRSDIQNAVPDNGHLSRYPCKSNTNTLHHIPIHSAHGLVRAPLYNTSMVEVCHVRMHPNIGTMGPIQEMRSNCKRECVGARFTDAVENAQTINLRNSYKVHSYYSDHIKDGRNYGKGTNFVVAAEELPANRRRILSDLNMGRSNLRKNNRVGEAQAWDYNQGRTARRNSSNSQELTCQTTESMWMHRKQNNDIEHRSYGQNHKNKCQRSVSEGTECNVNDKGVEFDRHSTSKDVSSGKDNNNSNVTVESQMWMHRNQNNDIEHSSYGQNHENKCQISASEGTECKVNDKGVELVSGKDNNNKKRELPSSTKSGPSRPRKQRNQAKRQK